MPWTDAYSDQFWEQHGFGPWAALEKDGGRWIGRIGLNLLADWPGTDNAVDRPPSHPR